MEQEGKKTSSTERKIISRVVGSPRNNDELPLIRRNKPLFAEYHCAQADFELSKTSHIIADNQPILDQIMADTVRQVEVDLALKYAEKHYPDFRLKIPKEDAAVECETAADGTKYVVFYPKDGDKSICYQKFILKNEKRELKDEENANG